MKLWEFVWYLLKYWKLWDKPVNANQILVGLNLISNDDIRELESYKLNQYLNHPTPKQVERNIELVNGRVKTQSSITENIHPASNKRYISLTPRAHKIVDMVKTPDELNREFDRFMQGNNSIVDQGHSAFDKTTFNHYIENVEGANAKAIHPEDLIPVPPVAGEKPIKIDIAKWEAKQKPTPAIKSVPIEFEDSHAAQFLDSTDVIVPVVGFTWTDDFLEKVKAQAEARNTPKKRTAKKKTTKKKK